jgi:DNA-binding PadR family transcriptional regulator
MGQDLPVTSYALLGLLTFGDELTGYELKQRADRTLRFYWTSPAMSQVYSELARLAELGLVQAVQDDGRQTTRHRITAEGQHRLERWLRATGAGFPVLKHPVALRLLLGHLVDTEETARLLEEYLDELAARRAELEVVRDSLRGRDEPGQPMRHPALVADWGLAYYAAEDTVVRDLLSRVRDEQ